MVKFERSDDFFETWIPVTREVAETELAAYYPWSEEIIGLLEASARATAPEPSGCVCTARSAYRATVAGGGDEQEE